MKMKRIVYLLAWMAIGTFFLSACRDDETYAEQKEREREVIASFVGRNEFVLLDRSGDTLISMPKIKVISEELFVGQDSTTNVADNEYVLFTSTGVYMQIVRRGAGERIKPGETKRLLTRYREFNIMGDSLQTTDMVPYWEPAPGIIDVSNVDGTISASFNTAINGGGAMYQAYRSIAVPSAWTLPLRYVKVGRQNTGDEGIAKVRLIVPHTEGQSDAVSNVYPCFYEILYQEM